MLIIKFSVCNQRIRRITSGIIPSNAYGKLKFEFDFNTDDWNKIETKTASFSYRGENYFINLDENNQCLVPEEVIYSPSFTVAVHGGDLVTNYVKVFVEDIDSGGGNIPPSEEEDTSGIVIVPSISEDKILSWTISKSSDDMEVPQPINLKTLFEWEEE